MIKLWSFPNFWKTLPTIMIKLWSPTIMIIWSRQRLGWTKSVIMIDHFSGVPLYCKQSIKGQFSGKHQDIGSVWGCLRVHATNIAAIWRIWWIFGARYSKKYTKKTQYFSKNRNLLSVKYWVFLVYIFSFFNSLNLTFRFAFQRMGT